MAADGIDEPIADCEVFFRRVLNGTKQYDRRESPPRVSSQAFTDREMEPSVDRARILSALGYGPAYTAQNGENGVLRIISHEVRNQRFVHNEAHFDADLEPRPRPEGDPENDAHCVIVLKPTSDKKGVFRKLIEKLALISTWEILPADSRSSSDLSIEQFRKPTEPL